MKGKIIVCRCEDVTLHDVEHSIEVGYADIEEVKRYTGFGTGPCQGKECLALVARVLAERTGVAADDIRPFTSRQPIAPTPLALFAQLDARELRLPEAESKGNADADAGASAERPAQVAPSGDAPPASAEESE